MEEAMFKLFFVGSIPLVPGKVIYRSQKKTGATQEFIYLDLEVVPAKAAVEAEGPQVVQVPPAMPRPVTPPPADETLPPLSRSPPPCKL